MAVEANNIPAIDDDLNTTVPNRQLEAWKMPEPVFRKTSGRLPQGVGESPTPSDGSPDLARTAEPSPTENLKTVSGQPESPGALPSAETGFKSSGLKILILALAIVAMIAFIVVFLTVVYFFFLRS